jgi:hypothetical protein
MRGMEKHKIVFLFFFMSSRRRYIVFIFVTIHACFKNKPLHTTIWINFCSPDSL